jgi:16S rRNA processing protein RimM
VRGDVRVIPLTDFPQRFNGLKKVILEDGKALTVEQARPNKQQFLLKFRGYDDRDKVDALRGKLLKVTREDLVELPEGHYYTFDIIGLNVFDESGEFIGVVKDILATGANDVYIAEKESGQPILIPAIKDVVKVIDLPGKRIIVKLQEWE